MVLIILDIGKVLIIIKVFLSINDRDFTASKATYVPTYLL